MKEAGKEDNTASKHEKMIGTKGNIVKDDEQVLVRKPSIVRKTGDNESNEVSNMISKEQKQEEPSQEGEKAKETMKKEATVVQKWEKQDHQGRKRKGGAVGGKEQRSKITDFIKNFNAFKDTKEERGE